MPDVIDTKDPFPKLGPADFRQIIMETSDLVIVLSADHVVGAVLPGVALRDIDFALWDNVPIRDLLTIESQDKLGEVLSDNAANPGPESRWRHLNFKMSGDQGLPLLIRYFAFEKDGVSHHVLCCRDLRDTERMQQMLQSEIMRYQKARENLELQRSAGRASHAFLIR